MAVCRIKQRRHLNQEISHGNGMTPAQTFVISTPSLSSSGPLSHTSPPHQQKPPLSVPCTRQFHVSCFNLRINNNYDQDMEIGWIFLSIERQLFYWLCQRRRKSCMAFCVDSSTLWNQGSGKKLLSPFLTRTININIWHCYRDWRLTSHSISNIY